MRLKKWAIMMAMVLAFGAEACGEEVCEEETEVLTVSPEAEAGTALLGDWTDFQLQIDGTVYQFPMLYGDWQELGWTAKDSLEESLEPYQYAMVQYEKDGRVCTVYILNLGINNEMLDHCIVAGMSVDDYDWDMAEGEILLPGGLSRGRSTGEEIQAAYGVPTNTYEGELYTQYTYEIEYNSRVEMTVGKESGVLEDVEVRNFVEPEGFDAGEVNTEVPPLVTAYQKPEALSEDMSAYEIEMDGQVYALPVPVSVLIEDGWELEESKTEKFIMAHYFGWVGLSKGGQSFRVIATNGEDYATLPENCWIESLEVGGFDLELDGALPGGVRIGITEEELQTLLQNNGVEYELEDSGDFKYYTYNYGSYDQSCEAMVYAGDSGSFPKNTVVEVTCGNPLE